MKKYLFLIFFISSILLHVYSEILMEDNKEENSIKILYRNECVESLIAEYNYIPHYERYRISIFPNGSIIGYLPQKNSELEIRAWNNLNFPFDFFFCDNRHGDFRIISSGKGYLFKILDDVSIENKWCAILRIGNSRLFKINQDGSVIEDYSFVVNFEPDVIELNFLNDTVNRITVYSMECEAEYIIDYQEQILRQTNVQFEGSER